MKIKSILLILIIGSLSTLVNAGKIAVFDLPTAISNTNAAQKSLKALQEDAEIVQIVEQIKGLEGDIQALNKEAESEGMTWSQERMSEQRKKIEFIQADRQLAYKKIQAKQQSLEQKIMQDMGPKLQTVLKKVSAEMDIDMIVKPQAIYFAVPDLDITGKVTAELNKAK